LRILITNNSLASRAGSELYVRDLAIGLLERGHTPIAYSSSLGEVAQEIRAATIPVIDNLDALAVPPDIIHGHHHLDTMTALLRFPSVPAVSVCHGWLPWEETPPRFPRILRYVAVDHPCRDRLLFEQGIPEDRIQVLLNFVDLERFKPRGPLPARPQRALIFSNQANEYTQTPSIREACARHGITVDVVGLSAGNVCARPEEILGRYDIVFAKGKAALESLASGAAVILCDALGVGPMVTSSQLDDLRPLNFGLRTLRDPVNVDILDQQIARYDAVDAAKVSRLVRASSGSDAIVDQLVAIYQDIIAENQSVAAPTRDDEVQAAAAYLRWLAPTLKSIYAIEQRASLAEKCLDQMRAECSQAQALLVERDQTLESLSNQSRRIAEQIAQQLAEKEQAVVELSSSNEKLSSTVWDLSSTVAEKEAQLGRITKSLGWRLLSYYGPIKYRFLLPPYRIIKKAFRSSASNR
jgi:hypothetical protein